MGCGRFLSLLAVAVGLVGAVFLSKGVLVLSSKDMVHSTYHYSAMAWPSKEIMCAMATQKTDTLIGVIYILLAFLIQVFSLVFVSNETSVAKSRWMCFWIVLAIVSSLTIVFSLVNRKIRNHFEQTMEKIVVRDYCHKRFVGRPVDRANVKGLESVVNQYFGLKREASENTVEFMKRIGKFVDWSLPEEMDFSRIEGNNHKG